MKYLCLVWLDPEIAGKWLFATAWRPMTRVEIDARVAGSFLFAVRSNARTVEHSGEYIEIVPHRRLVFTVSMNEHPHVTRVSVGIKPQSTGCELTLTHAMVSPDHVERVRSRWTGILYGLGETLAKRDDEKLHVLSAKVKKEKH